MTGSLPSHEPTPEFRAHLEWQIETALRRETRLAEPVTRGGLRHLRTALIVAVALAAGGVAGIASSHLQDAQTRQQLIESAMSEEALLRMRLELAQAEYQDARRRFEVGAVGRESLGEAARRVRAMESALKRLQLDIEETKATSAPPRNALNAPLVGKRDFVRDRLMLETQATEQELAAAEQSLERAKERVAVGVLPQSSVLQAETEVRLARDRMALLQVRLSMRQRYLQEQLSAEQLAAAVRRMELTVEQTAAQREIAASQLRIEALKKMSAAGLVSVLELKRAEVELLEAEVKLQNIQRQLKAVGKEMP